MKFKNIQHINEPGHIHELTFSCFKNQDFFKLSKACEWFADGLNQARERLSIMILAYVLMPNHVHVLIYPKEPNYNISKILSGIKLPLGKRIANYAKKFDVDFLQKMNCGEYGNKTIYRFWQRGGGYDRNLISKQAVLNAINYIHANPVRKRLVEIPEDWYWSSAGFYAGWENFPLKIDVDALDLLA